MKAPRGLSAGEAALWRRLTATVKPLKPARACSARANARSAVEEAVAQPPPRGQPQRQPAAGPVPRDKVAEDRGRAPPLSPDRGLDASWDRRLKSGLLAPDFTLDLHGHTLEQAHRRLDMGLGQASAMGARLVLLITGRPRPAEAADRGERRGAIRAKVLDWLAAGPHASDIAAIRKAHRRHGGDGALYIVLRRRR
jgi:DNA-nicking Smr family endonuclease